MFEKFFGNNEKSEIKEPEKQAETRGAAGMEVDQQTGVVMTRKESKEERKERYEDPTRRYDLK